jgi:hypothetical protein
MGTKIPPNWTPADMVDQTTTPWSSMPAGRGFGQCAATLLGLRYRITRQPHGRDGLQFFYERLGADDRFEMRSLIYPTLVDCGAAAWIDAQQRKGIKCPK